MTIIKLDNNFIKLDNNLIFYSFSIQKHLRPLLSPSASYPGYSIS